MATSRSSSSSSVAAPPEPPLMANPSQVDDVAEAAAQPVQQAITDVSSLIDPDGTVGTRFSGPIMSGIPGKGLAGIAMLHKRFKVTYAAGAFSGLPIQFPPSSILTILVTQIQQAFNGGTPHLNLGTTPGGSDVASIDLLGAPGPTQTFQNLVTILPSNWTLYLSLAIGAATQGKATMLISYSVPALTVPS